MLRVSKSVYESNAVPPVSSADKANLLSVFFDLTFFSIDQPRKRRTAGLDDTEFIIWDYGQCSIPAAEGEKRKLSYRTGHVSKLHLFT